MAARTTVRIKRVYDPPAKTDGLRILVDRLWPRGLSRAAAALDDWMPEVAPSAALRTWFGHDPARWTAFQQRYRRELAANPDAVRALAARIRGHRATLLFGAKDVERNQAVVVRDYLMKDGVSR
ncbi:MAG TPA: DUF488 family protein [Vicinamibacterales bacterium]|jgi:uncharacterized protein YeaO (DUF488 family)|nr:DUF488 family protein [Vicinamibacterales bacterium]